MSSPAPPAPAAKAPSGAIAVSIGLCLLIVPLWIIQVAGLSSLSGSDAAGNAMSQGFTAIAIILLWVLLGILLIIAATKGSAPWPASIAGFILVPVSGFVAMAALDLLSRPYLPPYLWPIVIPAIVPVLVVIYCFWALIPPLRASIPPPYAAGVIWGATFLLCAAIVPMDRVRYLVNEREAAALAKYDEDYAKLPVDAPL